MPLPLPTPCAPLHTEADDAWLAALPQPLGADVRALLPAAREAAWLAEEDDRLFVRAQEAVRASLTRVAHALAVDERDLFWLPLGDVRAAASTGIPPTALGARAAAARAEHERRRRLTPPLRLLGDHPLGGRPLGELMRGRGTGGQARGRVFRLDPHLLGSSSTAPPASPHVLVVPTVLPQMAGHVSAAVAVVAEHGGLLGHGAALARELGRPCIVACAGSSTLEAGESIWVDADAGLVVRLAPSRPRDDRT
ncbi:MAG: hypothetical protein EXR73_11640 [Myxococcales bacterium]|nr:hypothetical protein [Myxococcales bacterium]